MQPSFEIVARSRKQAIDPGDILEIAIYVSGFGSTKCGKLGFYFPIGLLAESAGDVAQGKVETNLDSQLDPKSGEIVPVAHSHEFELGMVGNSVLLGEGFFASHGPKVAGFSVLRVGGEFDWKGEPPVKVTAKVSRKADAGDHTIPFVLTFGDDNSVKTSRFDLVVHVRSFVERRFYVILVIALGLIGAAAAVTALFL